MTQKTLPLLSVAQGPRYPAQHVAPAPALSAALRHCQELTWHPAGGLWTPDTTRGGGRCGDPRGAGSALLAGSRRQREKDPSLSQAASLASCGQGGPGEGRARPCTRLPCGRGPGPHPASGSIAGAWLRARERTGLSWTSPCCYALTIRAGPPPWTLRQAPSPSPPDPSPFTWQVDVSRWAAATVLGAAVLQDVLNGRRSGP